MPGLNTYVEELEQIDLGSDSPQQIDLLKDVLTTGIELQLSINVDIAVGGGNDGVLLSETPHNLMEWVMAERDGDEFVGKVPGRTLAALQRYIEARPPRFTTFAAGGIQVGTVLQATYMIPFALPMLVNPFETVGYFAPVSKTLKLWIKRLATINYATFFTGGDRTLTLNSATVRVFQHYAKRPVSYRPAFLPRFEMADSRAISGSVPNFRDDLYANPETRLAFLLQCSQRDGVGVDDIINQVTLKSDRQTVIDLIPPATLTRREERFYPGIDASAGSTETGTHQGRPVGYLGYNFITDMVGSRWGMGRARMAANVDRSQGYRFNLDVTNGAGAQVIRTMKLLLESVPGWTTV